MILFLWSFTAIQTAGPTFKYVVLVLESHYPHFLLHLLQKVLASRKELLEYDLQQREAATKSSRSSSHQPTFTASQYRALSVLGTALYTHTHTHRLLLPDLVMPFHWDFYIEAIWCYVFTVTCCAVCCDPRTASQMLPCHL